MNLATILSDQAHRRPQALALFTTAQQLDFATLDHQVWQMASWLRQHGVEPGQVIATSLTDEWKIAIALLATARIGATFFSLPHAWPQTLRAHRLQQTAARFLLSDRPAPDLPPRILHLDHPRHLHQIQIDHSVGIANPTAPWLIITGSGSTGSPKLIPITHEQQRQRSQVAGQAWIRLAPDDRVVNTTPLEYAAVKTRFFENLDQGAATFLPTTNHPDPIALYHQAGVTVLHATVFHLESLLIRDPSQKRLLDGLHAVTVGSSTIPDELRTRIIQQLCPQLYIRYATNETGLLTSTGPNGACDAPGTVGRLIAGNAIRIINNQGYRLPPGQIGHILARSAGMIDGYLNDRQATEQSFLNGWFLTGDLGEMTGDGQLIHWGRADLMMIKNGINIYPAEIERALLCHPAIRDALALPIRHKVHQDIPIGVVCLHPDQQATEKELLAYARERLGPSAPFQIVILPQLPRNEQGKPQRDIVYQLLRERFNTPAVHTPPAPG